MNLPNSEYIGDYFLEKYKLDTHTPFLCGYPAVIFGGAVRDLCLGENINDIDIVIDGNLQSVKDALASQEIKYFETKFGGCRFEYNKQMYDIWNISSTWAIANGHVPMCRDVFRPLLYTTFFNRDSLYYDLRKKRLNLLHEYQWNVLHKRFLDIVLEKNPNPIKMAKRALSLATGKGYSLSKQLERYVFSHLPELNNGLGI